MELEEIKKQFEHKDFFVRSEFINKYHFEDEYRDYYYNFIKQNILLIKQSLYLSDLIDLANKLDFFDELLFLDVLKLFSFNALVVKLSVIAYIESKFLYENNRKGLEKIFLLLLQQRLRKIVRNDILLSLVEYAIDNNDLYLNMLLSSLKGTKDWRSIYKTLNGLDGRDIEIGVRKKIVDTISVLHKKNSYGEGIEKLISEL